MMLKVMTVPVTGEPPPLLMLMPTRPGVVVVEAIREVACDVISDDGVVVHVVGRRTECGHVQARSLAIGLHLLAVTRGSLATIRYRTETA